MKDEIEDWIESMEGESWPAHTANLNLLQLTRLRQLVKAAHEDADVEKLLKDDGYLEKLHAQVMHGVHTASLDEATLKVVEKKDSASAQVPDLRISRDSYSR